MPCWRKILAIRGHFLYTLLQEGGAALTIEKILFYGIIIVGAALIIGLTYYRIDWARHPEKYQDLVDQAEKDEKEAAQRRAMRRLGRKKRG